MPPTPRLAALALLLAPSPAGAEPAAARPYHVRLEAGGTTSTARLIDGRLAFGWAARPWISVEAGLGQSLGLEQDYLVLGAGPRLALGSGAHRFVAGARLAIAFDAPLLPKHDGNNMMSGTPVLLDLDVAGYERRFASGLALSAGVGAMVPLGGGRFWDNEGGELGDAPALRAQVGIGYCF